MRRGNHLSFIYKFNLRFTRVNDDFLFLQTADSWKKIFVKIIRFCRASSILNVIKRYKFINLYFCKLVIRGRVIE